MRRVCIGMVLLTLGWMASEAAAQGLYGAPAMLPLAPAGPLAPSASAYNSMPAAYLGGEPSYPQTQAPQDPQNPPLEAPPPATFNPPLAIPRPSVWNYKPLREGPPDPAYGESGPTSNDSPQGAGCGSIGELFGLERDPTYEPRWYFSASGLLLTHDAANGVLTTVETGTGNRLMQTSDANVHWDGGYEFALGAYLDPCRDWALEGDYWTIDRFHGNAGMSLLPAGTLSTPLVVDDIEFAGINGDHYFNNAATQYLTRNDSVQSLEVNLVRRFVNYDPCGASPFDFALCIGPRYFQFDEALTFATLANGGSWGGNGGRDEVYVWDRVFNTLIGGQIGLEGGCHVARDLRLFVIPQFGLYDNHTTTFFDVMRGDGVRATPVAGSGAYPVYAEKDGFSFLAQIDAGLDWEVAPRWNVFFGYRLVAATGIALADHQFPNDLGDFQGLSNVKRNGNLLVHGVLAGVAVEF